MRVATSSQYARDRALSACGSTWSAAITARTKGSERMSGTTPSLRTLSSDRFGHCPHQGARLVRTADGNSVV